MKKSTLLPLCRGAMVAALYVLLTYLSSLFGLASGAIQFRLSEMLCILPALMPEAIVGLTLGCLISNLLFSGLIWDILFGTLATLLGAIGAWSLRRTHVLVLTVPTVLANALIVPGVIMLSAGGATTPAYPLLALSVGVGEAVCAGIGGVILYRALTKSRVFAVPGAHAAKSQTGTFTQKEKH